ncbi:MAG: M20/M25/M40 family metallo-hydrolase [Chloroflexi bacterium]|nr:M20/M25/M40 family metallo-hydrolase [Chloroflexota bacterium]
MDHVKVLQDLLAIDTTVPPGRNYEKAAAYLEPLFRQAGFETQVVEIPPEYAEGRPGRVNLVCHRRSPGRPRLIFYTHVDVVPAEGWNAFQPWVAEGKVFGRGAADMKGGIVALLLGLRAVKDRPLDYDVSAIVTTDEEFSQASQIRYLAQFLQPVAGSYVFSLDSSFGFVAVTGLGLLQMDIRVKGKAAHSGLAHLGENAVEKAILLVQALLELKERVVLRKSSVDVHPETGLKKMEPRLNINVVQGGLKTNIIPDSCLISVDRRLIPEESMAGAEGEIMEALSSVSGVRWEIEKVFRIPPVPPVRGPVIDRLEKLIKEVTGQGGQYGEMGSGDLSTIVVREWKGQDFGLGVVRSECNIHARDEFVYLKDIEDVAAIIARFLLP